MSQRPLPPCEIAGGVLDRIDRYPETFYQRTWLVVDRNVQRPSVSHFKGVYDVETWADCGTTACVAGHTAAVVAEAGTPYKVGSISTVAEAALGLSHNEAEWLFTASRTRLEVVERLTELAADTERVGYVLH